MKKFTDLLKFDYIIKKVCIGCDQEREFSYYRKNDRNSDGYNILCEVCHKRRKPLKLKKIKIPKPKKIREIKTKKTKEEKSLFKKIYIRKKRLEDPLFKLSQNIRNAIKNSFRSKKHVKNSRTQEILGCSFVEFKLYLESKFEPWMNWENYGKYNSELNYGWDIDHSTPISFAKNIEELIVLNHHTNLQPLCGKVNRSVKKNKLSDNYKNLI